MQLATLLSGLDEPAEVIGSATVEVRGVSCDSRTTTPGDLFVALAGTSTHGARFAADAVARGAVAVAATEALALSVPVVRTAHPARLLGCAASRLAGDPSAALCLVGVTGTNGKTTTTHLLEGIWRAAGKEAGVIGTIAYRYAGHQRPAPYTTPDAPLLHRLLQEMRAAGTTHVAMEISSHALAQERVAGLQLDAALFSNLTRDHLDFHRDMERYYAAKARLFHELLPASSKPGRVAVVNVDNEPGRRLASEVRGRVVRVGRAADADVRLADATTTLAGSRGSLVAGGRHVDFESPLVGGAHLENVVLAAGAAWALGVDWTDVLEGLRRTPAPAGRVEQIAGPGFTVVVDYAHTPDALERVLAALRPLTPGRLLCVFGCGGDRDRGKRPLMGEAAARASDLVVLTSDNPRTERPENILAEIEAGVRKAGMPPLGAGQNGRGYVIEADRRAAIDWALAAARAGDVVLVAGKGHEDYQIVGTERRHLDDREEVQRVLGSARVSTSPGRLAATVAFELPELLAATSGELHDLGAAVRVGGVTTDTRGLEPGELFVPIRGPQHDGHTHLAAAAAAGAGAVLLERDACPGPPGCTAIVVRDTLAALGDLARWHRRRSPARVLAVAGSNGKTTTKEMLAAIVRRAVGAANFVSTQGSQNNLVGLPLTLLRLGPSHRVAVVELGMNVPGELWQLAGIAEPDVGVLTSIGPEHLEGVGSLRGAACAEGELFRRLRPSAVAVVNGDDPLIVEQAAGFPGRRLVFGAGGEVSADAVEDLGIDGTRFVLRISDVAFPIRLAVAGRHNVSNACAAAAVAHAAGIPSETIVAGLEGTAAPSMRMEIRRLAGDVTVLFDCYNANPASMAAALQTLAASRAVRRLAVLGEMRELGEHADAACRELGIAAAAARLDALILLGAQAGLVEESALAAGMDATRVAVAADHDDAARRLRGELQAGDVVLLKGSRGAALERVLERLEGRNA